MNTWCLYFEIYQGPKENLPHSLNGSCLELVVQEII
jgi:hypothetical protein